MYPPVTDHNFHDEILYFRVLCKGVFLSRKNMEFWKPIILYRSDRNSKKTYLGKYVLENCSKSARVRSLKIIENPSAAK